MVEVKEAKETKEESKKHSLSNDFLPLHSTPHHPSHAHHITSSLKLAELLSRLASVALALDLQDIEADSLGQGTAFTDSDNITNLDANEGRRAVSSQVLVSLFVTVVLLDVVQVFTADDDGALHLGAHDGTGEDTATDRDVSGEGALLVNVGAGDGFLRGDEAQTDVLVPAGTLALGNDALVVGEDGVLLLERLVVL